MFKAGHIYYFKSFKFNNEAEPKEKYFIVLKETKNSILIGTLPTRTNKIPSFVDKEHGCINILERQYNCYLFQQNKPVCKNGFGFNLPTFVYGSDIDYYRKEKFMEDHPIDGTDYIEQGELSELEFKQLLECFQNSNAVKKGIKRALLS